MSRDDLRGVAVIGLAGRFPGARDVDELWRNLRAGVESVTFFSPEELRRAGVDPGLLERPDYVRARAMLDGVEEFDAAFFGFTPREAELTDPQHRLFLEHAWQAVENAGYDPRRYRGPIGVFAGSGVNAYLLTHLLPRLDLRDAMGSFQTSIHNKGDHLTTRVAYELDLRGPAVSVQTACSTSLVAAALACQSLLNYQCDMALAGGVTITLPQVGGYLYQPGGIASPDGHCRAFDVQAQGTVDGSGVGVVVLKRLEDAVRDGDTILAVIKGAAINNDGAVKAGYTAPGMDSQAEVIATAQALADIDARGIGYVEAHGTGTPLGDPIEISALTRAFRLTTEDTGFCAVGSVKTNFGHLDAAAGIVGLIKAVLALHYGEIPPSLHFESPNPAIDFTASPFYVNTELCPWPVGSTPRRAGVSSFGIGGTNAHLVLEEAPKVPASEPGASWQLLVLSARSGPALEAATENLARHLEEHPGELADVAWTLQTGRAVFEHRRAVVARGVDDAVDALRSLDPERVFQRIQTAGHRPVTFLFPGQGSQYPGMGAGLYEAEPVFRREVDRCLVLLEPGLAAELRSVLFPLDDGMEEAARRLERTEVTQPALFVVEYALARLWVDWGVTPRSFLGHSVGEYVAACLAEVITLEEALALVAARGRLIGALPGGAMLSVSLPERELLPRLGGLALAAVNGPSMCVASGPVEAIDELERRLTVEGVVCRRLHTSHAFHSEMMEPALEAFRAEVCKVRLQPPAIPYLSNLTGTWITDAEATDPGYWVEHLRRTVRFADGVEELLREPDAVLLEVGPGRTLKTAARWHPGKGPRQVVETSLPHPRERRPDPAFLLGTAGRLWLAGVELDWERLHDGRRRRRVPLPSYPFERRRYWIDPPAAGQTRTPGSLDRKEDLGDWFYQPVWRESPAPVATPAGGGPWLVLAREGGIGERLAARLGPGVVRVAPGEDIDWPSLLPGLRGIVHAWCAEEETEPDEWALDLGFHALLGLARALAERPVEDGLTITVLSSGMQPVTGAETLRPERATLLGPVKVIPREDPRLRCRSIDLALLPPAGSRQEERLLDRLAAEIAAAPAEPVVAWRGERRWVQDHAPIHLPALQSAGAPGLPLRERGVYLITGGLGGVGLEIAELLAESARARLVLAGRSPFPERENWAAWTAAHGEDDPVSRRIRRLERLEALGAEVMTASADVADHDAMAALVERARERFGSLHGAIHAAGLPDGGLIQLRTREASDAVLAAKVRGTRVLAEVCGPDVDFLVLCSSLSGIVGRLGQVAYGAANSFLDAFAYDHTARTGVFTLSVDWGEWLETGMAAGLLAVPSRTVPEVRSGAPIHPFLESHAVGADGEEVYTTRFSVDRHWVVDEHRLVGNAVIPGVAYFEMLRAALAEKAAGRAMRLSDVVFVAPVQVRDNAGREVRLHLIPDGDGFRFAVRSPAEAGEGTEGELRDYVVGRAELVEPPERRRYDLEEIRRRCGVRHVVWGDEDKEDDLGPRWQNVKRAWVGEREVLTRLELADELRGDLEVMKLHPALIDRAAGVAKEFLIDGTYLPLTYGRLTVLGEMPDRIYSYARLREAPGSNLETLTFDISVIDDRGVAVAEIEEFSQKRINDATVKIRTASAGDLHSGRPREARTDVTARERQEMRPAEGVEALRRLLAWRPGPQVAVSVRDLQAVLAQADAAGHERILEETAKRQETRPAHPRPALSTPYAAPRNDAERAVATAWQEMLGIDRVGVDDNFFELGGDSVQAIQIIASLRAAGLELTPQQFFQHQTIADLVAHAVPSGLGEVAEADLPGLSPEEMRHLGLGPDEMEDAYPLSPMQQGMLFHTLYAPGSGEYVEQVTWTLEGDLDEALFAAAWRRAVEHHPALRTTFVWEDLAEPLQVVHPPADLPIERLDGHEVSLAGWLEADRRAGFDPGRWPLLRLAELRLGERERRFVWTYHHLLMDGWAAPLVLRDVSLAYEALTRGEEPRLEPARPYRDYIAWLRRQDRAAAEDFWRGEFAGLEPPEPIAAPVPGAQETYRTERVRLPETETSRLRAFARQGQLTLNTLVQGAWALLLSRYGAGEDVVFGGVVSGRPPELAGVEGMVGLFINTLPVRVKVPDEADPIAWLKDLQTRQLAARSFEHTALAEVREWSGLPPDRQLFDSILVFENLPDAGGPGPGDGAGRLVLRDVARAAGRTGFPLTVEAFPGAELAIDLTGDGRFEPETLAQMARHLLHLLAALPEGGRLGDITPLSPLSPLSDDERRQLLPHPLSFPWQGPVHRRFAAWADRRPEAPAVTCGGERVSYGELERRANRLAHHLIAAGVGPGSLVALLLEPSVDLIVAILAVFKAGGAYQPLDPEAPAERLDWLLADGGSRVMLTRQVLDQEAEAIARRPETAPIVPDPGPDGLAYVIYTSGSTGRHKGVEVTHGNVARLFDAVRDTLAPDEADVWTLFHSAAFDFSVWEVWGALAHGGHLVVVPPGGSRETEAFHALLARERVTVLSQTPSAFEALQRVDENSPARLPLRLVVFGGEALDPGRLAGWLERYGEDRPRLVNMYGITETTVHVTLHAVTAEDVRRPGASPIGLPLPDLTVHLLDQGGRLVPAGVPGEAHVGGAGVARGYRGRPDLTAERFVPDPFAAEPGARLYRSGDLARRRADGSLEYLRRIDHQVKVRGYRVEPAEIEAALSRHPELRSAVVEALPDAAGGRRLVAFVVPRRQAAPPAEELRGLLAGTLPPYMLPSAFVPLSELPLTANGKVDRRALAHLGPDGARPDLGTAYVAPSTPAEVKLAALWSEMLGVDRVGTKDSFFDLGGHSLLAARTIGRMRAVFHLDLPVGLLFERPVLGDLAAWIEREHLEQAGDGELEALLAELEGLSEEEAALMTERDRNARG